MSETQGKIKRALAKIKNSENNKRLIKSVAGNYLVKGGAMLVSLLIMPAYLSYFQSQTLLGMWFTAAQVVSWIAMFDFGIGASLRNLLVKPLLDKDTKEVKELLSTAYIAIGAVITVMIIAQAFIVRNINLYSLLGIKRTDISEGALITTIHILVVGICIRFFLSLIFYVFYAMQRPVVSGFLTLLSNVLILLFLMITKPSGKETDIILLAIVQAIAYCLPIVIVTIIMFAGKIKSAIPSFASFKKEKIKSILGTGGSLFYLQLLITFIFGVKELFISWFVGAAQVVDYQIYYKLIGVVSGLFTIALAPIWSEVTKAYVTGNFGRIRKLYKTGTFAIGLFSLAQVVLVLFMPWLCKIWLGTGAIPISYTYGLLFCLYNTIQMWVMLSYNFACGMGRTKVISICLTITFVLNIVLAYWWCTFSPVWITVVVATAVAAIPCAIFAPKDILKWTKKVDSY